MVIEKHSGESKVTMSGKDASGTQTTYAVPAHLAGSKLEITVDDFRLVFTIKDPTHLQMKVQGTVVGASAPADDSKRSVVLVKDD